MHKENWDDLRYVLAVADHGSVSAAARVLGVNHATVLRRVFAFEERHGSVVFDKSQHGYFVPPDRMPIIEAAREVDAAVVGVKRVLETAHNPLSGLVKVTSTDTICYALLPEIIHKVAELAPHLHVEVICSNARLDIARMDADIAIRPAGRLPDHLAGQIAAKIGFGVYAAEGAQDGWLGFGGIIAKSPPASWLKENVPHEQILATADSFVTLARMAQAGIGRAILPRFVGDQFPGLLKVRAGVPNFELPLWVACHSDLAEIPRVKAVHDFLLSEIGSLFRRV